MPSIAHSLADYAGSLSFDRIDDSTVHQMKRQLIDTLGAAIGAFDHPTVNIVRRALAPFASGKGVTLWGTDLPAAPTLSVFHNSVIIRALDLVSTYASREGAHPCDNIAAILAGAELAESGGKDIITAMVGAYEVHCRLCDAANLSGIGWDHDTYGAISVALGFGAVLGLSSDQLHQAVNIACVHSPMLGQSFSGHVSAWKSCTFASNAQVGVMAALLAQKGLDGPEKTLEGPMGFRRNITGQFDFNIREFGGLGQPFKVGEVILKVWPSLFFLQTAIDAAVEIHHTIPDPMRIDAVNVHTFGMARDIAAGSAESWEPISDVGANHSMPYCVAAALLRGDITLDSFGEAQRKDERLRTLIKRTKVVVDDDFDRHYPESLPCRLVVSLASGEQRVVEKQYPLGHPKNPMSDRQIERKFLQWGNRNLAKPKLHRILDLLWNIDQLPNISELNTHLSAGT